MRLKFAKSSRKIALVALFFFSLFLTYLPENNYSTLQMSAISIAAPLGKGAFSLASIILNFFEDLFNSFGASRKARESQVKIAALENKIIQQHNEIITLRDMVNALTAAGGKDSMVRVPLEVAQVEAEIPAEIISISSANWRRILIVNAGSRRNIEVNMPVVWKGAIVGRVFKVGGSTSAIQLINDPDFRIWVIDLRSREQGIVRGDGSDTCVMDYVPVDGDVRKGDLLISSGLEGIYPRNYVVGNVINNPKKGGALFQQDIKVKPRSDIRKIENVIILKINKPLREFSNLK